MNNAKIVLETQGLVKRFPGVIALKGIDFDLRQGEIHALLGQNGAGKSTFVKVLNGVHSADDGKIMVDGREVVIRSPYDARRLGITLIHQEVMVIPNLTVVENIFLSLLREYGITRLIGSRRFDYLVDEAKKYLDILGLNIDPRTKVKDLRVADKQLIQFARALAEGAKIICVDELTSALSPSEVGRVFEVMTELKREKSFIFITHRIEEAFKIADRITVLREGLKVMTKSVSETNPNEVVKAMVGRELSELYVYKEKVRIDKRSIKPLLKVENLSTEPLSAAETPLRDISFELYPQEILGVIGLLGAGKTELGMTLIGMQRIVSGRIYIGNREVRIKSPSDALRNGIAYLTEDRKTLGIIPNLSVVDNIVLPKIPELSLFRLWRKTIIEREIAMDMIKKFNIITPSPSFKVSNLSGGNQQKVLLARLLLIKPKILILDEPTFGIDIGSKAEIRRFIKELVEKEGISIILLTSDIDEAVSLSDRLLVLRNGRALAILEGEEITRDKVISLLGGA